MTFLFICSIGQGQTKVGTINEDYVLSQMPEMTEVQKGLENYEKELQNQLETDITEYETLVKQYQDSLSTYSEEIKQQKETAIIELENTIKGFRQKATVMMQLKRNELTTPLYEKINNAMLQVVESQGYTHILHAGGTSLAYSSDTYDITSQVLEELGIEVKTE